MKGFIFVVLSALLSNAVFAKAPAWLISDRNVNYVLTLEGAFYRLVGRHLLVYIDQEKNDANFDARIKGGFYTKTDVADYWRLRKDVESFPILSTFFASIQSNTVIIPGIYFNNPGLDQIVVHLYHVHRNNYGNKVTDLFASFNMNRKLSNKIDWEHINYLNVIEILPSFHISEYAYAELYKEKERDIL